MVCYCLPQPEPRSLDSASSTVPQGVPRGGEVGFTPPPPQTYTSVIQISTLKRRTIEPSLSVCLFCQPPEHLETMKATLAPSTKNTSNQHLKKPDSKEMEKTQFIRPTPSKTV